MKHLAQAPADNSQGSPPGAQVRLLTIDERHDGQRLDNFLLVHCKGVPRSHLYQIVRSGQVRVNQARVSPDFRLSLGDRVRIPPVRVARAADPLRTGAAVVSTEFPVIHESEGLLAIDKPAGIAVHGGSGVRFGVIEQIRAARPQARMIELVHRIDRDTSGLLLLATRRPVLTGLHDQLRQGRMKKRYRAIVCGDFGPAARELRFALHKFVNASGERRVVVHESGGQTAGTRVRTLQRRHHPRIGPVTLVEADLETGRTHQIRVHLAHVGHPLLGDDKYGDPEINKVLKKSGYKRMFLHAFSITLEHPEPGRKLRLEAPMPTVFQTLLSETTQLS